MDSFIAADERLGLHDWTVGDLLEHAAKQAPESSRFSNRRKLMETSIIVGPIGNFSTIAAGSRIIY
jgi:hypothetical protein